ncbi:hypothetical protein SKAU_G00045100 [Synaphobranchus kaupii]|uniref:Uncharacterized protein n=1 Tax=Synaphobranchus kaupii TaxID=118154 RepID=A0A9Q1G212_SYNKA|nr:hypothetical protein SKAU_G00045100 [Synaphobranchus kaupii]
MTLAARLDDMEVTLEHLLMDVFVKGAEDVQVFSSGRAGVGGACGFTSVPQTDPNKSWKRDLELSSAPDGQTSDILFEVAHVTRPYGESGGVTASLWSCDHVYSDSHAVRLDR